MNARLGPQGGLERTSPMLAPNEGFTFARQGREGADNANTTFGGINHRVNESTLACRPRRQIPLSIVLFETLLFVGLTAPMQDLDRSLGTHDRNFGRRPRQTDVISKTLGIHDDVGAPESLAQDEADPG